jgi:predicted acyl esterase
MVVPLDEIFLAVKFYLDSQARFMFGISLIMVLIGRVIWWCAFFLFWQSSPGTTPSTTNQRSFRWGTFWVVELCIIGLGILNNIGAVFVVVYSVSAAGGLLTQIPRDRTPEECLQNKRIGRIVKLAKPIGYFLNPVAPLLAILTLLILITYENPLTWELGASIVAYCLHSLWRVTFGTRKDAYLQRVRRQWWHRFPTGVRVGVLIVLVVGVGLFGGLYYWRIGRLTQVHMVPMRDGVKLKTYVHFPVGWDGEPKGVILSRTPYNANAENMVSGYANYYAHTKGYIVVLQDLRGTGGSKGSFPIFNSDNTDGVDTVNWIRKQSWSNGRIASIGGSAVATNQYYYHVEAPEGLLAANLLMGASDFYDYWSFPGGCYRNSINSWWLPAVTNTAQIEELWRHPTKDSYWTNTSIITNNRRANVNLRAVHIGGWFDVFAQGTVSGFMDYNYYGTEYARNHQIMVMGPWGHGPNPVHHDITYPDAENYGWQQAMAAEEFLFQEALNGVVQDWTDRPRVYYYVMGDPDANNSTITFNHWRTAMDWPIPTTIYEPWYFHPNGTLTPNLPTTAANRTYIYDPGNPVRSAGGNTLFPGGENGAWDQAGVENGRDDILAFYSPVLTEPLEIIGRLNATLFIASNCTDTDFAVKLMDVFPDGREMYIASGILKTRYRAGFAPEQVELLTNGTIYELSVDLWSTAYHFSPAHRIKVSITSSNYPAFSLNPNTGAAVSPVLGDYVIAQNTVLCGDSSQPSCIWFPRNVI